MRVRPFFPMPWPLLAAGLVLLGGCELLGPNGTTPDNNGMRHGDLHYAATMVAEDAGLDSGPMSLRAVVTVTNPKPYPVDLAVAGCTVWLQAYAIADPDGAPLWEPDGECQQGGETLRLQPGERRTFEFLAHDVMLAFNLPDGLYHFKALFRLQDETLTLDAGPAEVLFAVPGLHYRTSIALTDAAPRMLEAAVEIANTNSKDVRLTYGACALNLSLYPTADRTGPPAFDWSAHPAGPQVCIAILYERSLSPGETLEDAPFRLRIPLDVVLGDAGPPGRYYATLHLSHNWRTLTLDAGPVDLQP